MQNRTENCIIIDAKVRKGKNVEVLYTKNTWAAAYMIQLTLVYILTCCIVCTLFVCTRNVQRLFQLGSCIGSV